METSWNLKIFYPDSVATEEIEDFNRSYELWHRIWVETREEVTQGLPTPSDNFSRQSEILVLFSGQRAIGTICHRYVDLRHTAIYKDTFFNPSLWPEGVLGQLPSLGNSCVLGSHIFIDPDFRKNSSGLSTKNLLCALSFGHLNGTAPDVVLGMMRKDKNMHGVFYKSGAVTLHPDTHWYQIPVDLVAFFPSKKAITVDPDFASEAGAIGARCSKYGSNFFERSSTHKLSKIVGRSNEGDLKKITQRAG